MAHFHLNLLLIYTNSEIKGIDCDNLNVNVTIISRPNLRLTEQLYHASPKNFLYYLFLDRTTTFSPHLDIDHLIQILQTYQPAAVVFPDNTKVKIYHRSLIHYIYPLMEYDKYGDSIFEMSNILDFPVINYIYFYSDIEVDQVEKVRYVSKLDTLIPRNSRSYAGLEQNVNVPIPKVRTDQKLYDYVFVNLFSAQCELRKLRNYIDYKRYYIATVAGNSFEPQENISNPINYLRRFNIRNYFNPGSSYFGNHKRVKFVVGDREIYGDVGTYHFAHDFANSQRNHLINHLILINNYQTYLEVGTHNCAHFGDIHAPNKTGVDPAPPQNDPTFKQHRSQIVIATSQQFFSNAIKKRLRYDIIFIDGCLVRDNVRGDILSALTCLKRGGTILIHDSNPPNEFLQRDMLMDKSKFGNQKIIWNNRTYSNKHYNGQVWKVLAELRTYRHDLEVRTVDTDWGMGIIRRRVESSDDAYSLFEKVIDKRQLYEYDTLMKYRRQLLNLITVPEFIQIYSRPVNQFQSLEDVQISEENEEIKST